MGVDYSQTGSNSSASDNRHPRQTHGLEPVPFQHTVTFATTDLDNAADFSLLFEFPANAIIDLDSLVLAASDMDTGGTPALVADYGLGDSDGTIDTLLIDDSTLGQAAGIDRVDEAKIQSNGRFLSVGTSAEYLIMDIVTAAATAAAGTIEVSGVYYGDNLESTTAT